MKEVDTNIEVCKLIKECALNQRVSGLFKMITLLCLLTLKEQERNECFNIAPQIKSKSLKYISDCSSKAKLRVLGKVYTLFNTHMTSVKEDFDLYKTELTTFLKE